MKVSLRPIEKSDTDNILKWRNHPNVRRNFVFQDDITFEAHERWMNERVSIGKVVQFIIVTEEFGDIGSVYLRDIYYDHRKAEFGIFIGEEKARGKGFGTEATRLALEHAFDVLNLNKVFLRVFPDNDIAIRSYESVGFVKEGYLAEDVIVKNKPYDMIIMAILQSQYNSNRSNT